MHLVQLLLPIHDNQRQPFPGEVYLQVRQELTDQFGGLTIYTRAPAEGLWRGNGNGTSKDDIVIFEVMTETLDRPWWSAYRRDLESRFRQDVIVIRAQATQLL